MDGVEVMSFTGSDGYDYGLSLPILTLIAVIIFTGFLMSKTRIGRQIYAVGGNADAAKRVGISILGVMLFVYGYMGALAGIASVVQTQITQSVAPNALMGFELTVLAAVVLGGVSMTGGKGSLTGYPRGCPAGNCQKRPDPGRCTVLLAHRADRAYHCYQYQLHRV